MITYKNPRILFLLCLFFFKISAFAENNVEITSFGVQPNSGLDATQAVRSALDFCRKNKAKKLIFTKGRYDFWPNKAIEKYAFISNNDEGLKRITFSISGMSSFEIDGCGSEFVFHGFICPFVIEKSKNIIIRNFSIDWERPLHNEGRIVRSMNDSIDIQFSENYPYKIDHDLLRFEDLDKTNYPFRILLEFDAIKKETAYKALDYYTGPNIKAKEIGNRVVRLYVPNIKGQPGNIMVFWPSQRPFPAITISDCEKVSVFDASIHHAGGMGIIAQRSADLQLERVRVTLPPNKERILTATADATHFVNCRGKITMDSCLFENQGDDASNIHGIYAQITKIIDNRSIEIKLIHPQQFGFDFISTGSNIEFVNRLSMNAYSQQKASGVERLNKEYTKVKFKFDIPKQIKIGDVVACVDNYPDVNISNCIIRNNRGRGLLLGSRGKILIENNVFHTPGSAIVMEGDARYWFEQAGVNDLRISKNTFDNCNFGIWGNSIIQVSSGIEKTTRSSTRYNKNILIENNVFKIFDPRIINIYSVDNLVFRNNILMKSKDYLFNMTALEPFTISESSNIHIEDFIKAN